MNRTTLEDLERRVAALESAVGTDTFPRPNGGDPDVGPRKKNWRKVVGMFRGDPVFARIVAEGAALREAERETARREADAEDAAGR